PVEAIKDDKVRLVGILLAFAGAAAQHLFKQNAGLHRAQEDDEFQIGNIDAGREHIDRDNNSRIGPIAKFSDALQWAICCGAGNLLDEGIAPAENIAADVNELIGVGSVRQIVLCEDQRLRK